MSTQNGTTAQDLLGVPDIIVELPCEVCAHRFDEHTPDGCTQEHALVGVIPAAEEGGKPTLQYGPCACIAFEGALDDGKPRALKLRMPSNMEWSSIKEGFSLPVKGIPKNPAQPQQPDTPQRRLDSEAWARKLVQVSVTHIRKSGGEWQRVRIVEKYDEVQGPWDLCIETLDRAGGQLVEAIALQLIHEFNDGGPFGGVVRNFRSRRDGDLRVAVKRGPEHRAARVVIQQERRAGGVPAPGEGSGDDLVLDVVPPRAGDAPAD